MDIGLIRICSEDEKSFIKEEQRMKEYGGYLPFDFKDGHEYYSGEDVIALNCARNAIVYAVLDGGYDKLYIPFYMCNVVRDALDKYNVICEAYHIDEAFNPIGVRLKKNEGILYANYFGLFSKKKIESVISEYKNVILDNTQAFFAKPIMEVYNVYSCRKFFGVCDGAYVIKKGINRKRYEKYEVDESAHRISYLFKCIEKGTNAAYKDSLETEKELTESPIRKMSLVTHKILQMTDYDSIIAKRKSNFDVLNDIMSSWNLPRINRVEECVPFVYPFFYEDEGVRERLISNHIYVPQWWKYLLQYKEINEFERRLVNGLLPLPIDQRYTTKDMHDIAAILK